MIMKVRLETGEWDLNYMKEEIELMTDEHFIYPSKNTTTTLTKYFDLCVKFTNSLMIR